MTEAEHPDLAGTQIGPYRILHLLGRGATSEVYAAEHGHVGSRHALKIYAYPHDDPEVRRRFEAEGRLLARLDHPRIVKVTDFGVNAADGRPFFTMTLVADAQERCRSLADIPAVELDEERVGRWYDDMRDGLAYIHGKGIVHRDLKLQNVLVGPDDHVVLTDFGISRIFAPAGAAPAVINPIDTILRVRDGKKMVMGSIGYMAPELEMGVAASPQSDWYALGVIVYKLLTGTWCDARTDVVSALETFDPVWTRILPKLLHANPAGRACPGYAEEKEALRQQAACELENLRLYKRHRRFVRRWTSIGAAACLLVLAGAGAWHYGGLARELYRVKHAMKPPIAATLFAIPPEAGDEETPQCPARRQFASARIDACVLTQPLLDAYAQGTLRGPELRTAFGRMMTKAKREATYRALFADLPSTYRPSGEGRALSILLHDAARHLAPSAP